jgi:hypothetical protein
MPRRLKPLVTLLLLLLLQLRGHVVVETIAKD